MILAFELTRTAAEHAPFNGAMARIMAAAFPGETVRVHADAAHLAELALDGAEGIEAVPVARPMMHEWRTHIVSFARFRAELAVIRAAVRAAPAGERLTVVLLSATPTAIWAACLAARARGGRVQAMLHGNLADAVGWRPRNPLARRFDLASTLRSRLPAPVRYVVFAPHILAGLARIAPRAAASADVVPHPLPPGAPPDAVAADPFADGPVRIGFIGLGTRAKGFDAFLELAARVAARLPGRASFHLLGSVRPEFLAAARAAPLAEPAGAEQMPRAAFEAGLARMHYAALPFRPGYYDLSASGALLDAVAWQKPVLTARVPLTEAFFAEHGQVGETAEDAGGLEALVERVLASRDSARYASQAEAMRRARGRLTVQALTCAYARAAVRLWAEGPPRRGEAGALP